MTIMHLINGTGSNVKVNNKLISFNCIRPILKLSQVFQTVVSFGMDVEPNQSNVGLTTLYELLRKARTQFNCRSDLVYNWQSNL